ncbi:MAG: helix-turn-helix transcriptional regulator [Reichenbachiella sp.]|uniref:helix-turn-helix transcriptional regulator n=1 Tax=Reichenbachiella sp. TaxID=2184521 RepID=UPI0032631DE4
MTGYTNTNWHAMDDLSIIRAIGHFIKTKRLELNKTQAQLAKEAGLNRWTLSQIENGGAVTLLTLIQLLRSLDALYVLETFIVEEKVSPVAYAKMRKQQRKKASGGHSTEGNEVAEPDNLGW